VCAKTAVADPPPAGLEVFTGACDCAEADFEGIEPDPEELPSLLAPAAAGPPNTKTGALKRTDHVCASTIPELDTPSRRWNS
jgi:hypothetical protein